MNRGARREPTFRDPHHCSMFLEHLGRIVLRFGLEVHAYVLMPNHFHLLVRSVRGNLSLCMKHLLSHYTQELNQKHGWDGPVFRGRFNNQLVSESEHLRVVIPYIHLNPVRARLVTSPEFALWSSYTAYCGVSEKPEWLTMNTVMSLYGSVDNLEAETRGYRTGALPWPSDFDLRKGIFRSWSPEIPRTADEKVAWRHAQTEHVRHVCEAITGVSWDETRTVRRGRGGNPARRLAVWLLATRTEMTHKEIAAVIGGAANHVTLTLHFIRKGRFGSPLREWIEQTKLWPEDAEDRPNGT